MAELREAHAERIRARDAAYYAEHRAAYLERDARRREREATGPGVSAREWHRICIAYRGSGDGGAQCWACHTYVLAPQMDHLIPLSRGGQHRPGNVAPACGRCNSSRSNRLIVEWRLGGRRGRVPVPAQR